MQDLIERKRRAQEEEEEADPELKELRQRAMEAEAKMTKKKEENDPLFVFIIENFTLEMERVSPLFWVGWCRSGVCMCMLLCKYQTLAVRNSCWQVYVFKG